MSSIIVVFDAHCLLCSGWVQFLLKHDRKQRLKFASMQSAAGIEMLSRAGLDSKNLETLLVVMDGRHYCNTAAIFRVLHVLGWPWRCAWVGWLVPSPLRDWIYRHIAINRYRFFGRKETCLIPAAEHLNRFIEKGL